VNSIVTVRMGKMNENTNLKVHIMVNVGCKSSGC
jgi:hypothetical protein